MHVPAWGTDASWRWAVMVLGGPLANLLLGVACLAAASWLNPAPAPGMLGDAKVGWRSVALLYPGGMPSAYLNVAGLLSLGLGLVNLVPCRGAIWPSDGGQLLDLWRLHKAAQAVPFSPIGAELGPVTVWVDGRPVSIKVVPSAVPAPHEPGGALPAEECSEAGEGFTSVESNGPVQFDVSVQPEGAWPPLGPNEAETRP
jgi:hypothetical protein